METTIPLLETKIANKTGVITLDNPTTHNALSTALINQLCETLKEMQNKQVRVVILRAKTGVRVFSSGHDVRELPATGRDPLTYNDPLRRLIRIIELFPAPVIAMVEGSVWGGACELVMSCDLIVASEDCTFAVTPAKLGMPYNISGVQNFLNTGGMPLCKEMLFTAAPITVQRLVLQGIVTHAVPRGQLEGLTMSIAEQIARNSPLVISLLKEELDCFRLRTISARRPSNACRQCGAWFTTAKTTRKGSKHSLKSGRHTSEGSEHYSDS